MKFPAQIIDKKLVFTRMEWVKTYLGQMKDGQVLVIDIEKRKNIRSNSQNSLYWGLILPTIAEYTGHTSEELHCVFKRQYLPRKYIRINGKKRLVDPTTTKLTTKEFTDYIEQIMVWSATELGIEWNI